jgi:hypothetical protein
LSFCEALRSLVLRERLKNSGRVILTMDGEHVEPKLPDKTINFNVIKNPRNLRQKIMSFFLLSVILNSNFSILTSKFLPCTLVPYPHYLFKNEASKIKN